MSSLSSFPQPYDYPFRQPYLPVNGTFATQTPLANPPKNAPGNAINMSRGENPVKKQLSHLALAGLLFTTGLASHHLPGKTVSPKGQRFFLPPDWKSWARVGLGIGTVSQLNQGMGWKPPAWVTGLMSAAVITPMAMHFKKAAGLTFLLIAPLVAVSVQASQWLNKAFTKDLKRQWGVPEPVSQLLISLSVGGLGVAGSLALHRHAPSWKILGKKIFEPLSPKHQEAMGSFVVQTYCARGCTPSIICLSQVGEMLGGMTNWYKGRLNSDQNPGERR